MKRLFVILPMLLATVGIAYFVFFKKRKDKEGGANNDKPSSFLQVEDQLVSYEGDFGNTGIGGIPGKV